MENRNTRRRGKKNKKIKKIEGINLDRQISKVVIRELKAKEEVKVYDIFTQSTITATPTFINITAIPQGIAQSQRIGDKVNLIMFDLELEVNYPFTSAIFTQDMYDNIRKDTIQWRNQSNVTPITSALLYENIGAEGLYSAFNWEQRMNYRVFSKWRDFITGFYDSAATASTPTSKSVLIYRRTGIPLGTKLVFTPTTTGAWGHIYIVLQSDSAAVPHPLFTLVTRVYYSDA